MENPRPFRLEVSDAVLADLQGRLAKTRFPDQLAHPANEDWAYGTEKSALEGLVRYWKDGFDWKGRGPAVVLLGCTVSVPTASTNVQVVSSDPNHLLFLPPIS